MMEAIILAGGMGTRLKDAVPDLPKPMAPVRGVPFLDYLLDFLVSSGISHFVFAVCYKADVISDYYGNDYRGIPIDYSYETRPLGTGGAIKKAFELIKDDCALILNGDTYCEFDVCRMFSLHSSSDFHLSICCKMMENFDRYGSVEISDNVVTKFREKKHCDCGYINCGAYITDKSVFWGVKDELFSFENDILSINSGKINAYITDGLFIDIGIPEDYYLAQKILPDIKK